MLYVMLYINHYNINKNIIIYYTIQYCYCSRYNLYEVINMAKLVIPKKKLKGDDGHKVFSIRIKEETITALDDIADKTNRSRNEIINILLEYGIENCEIE